MNHPRVSNEEMQHRISRFSDLKQNGVPLMFIDSVLPGHQRMNYALIGDTASENAEFKPAISSPHKFQIGMGFAPPGNGPAFHTHDYVESFLVLEGEWRFYWGNEPGLVEGEAILGKWDFISIPPGLYRGFEVSGERVGWFFAVLDPHEVYSSKDPYWDPEVERKAAEYGFKADASGKMVKPPNYDALRLEMMQKLINLETADRAKQSESQSDSQAESQSQAESAGE
jgi:quercetin dioxygenase-like cupin family protein